MVQVPQFLKSQMHNYVFIFTLQHAINKILVSNRMRWRMKNSMELYLIMSDYVQVTQI